MGSLVNNGKLDEIPYYASFHQDLHCLLRQNRSSEKEIHFYFFLFWGGGGGGGVISVCDPLLFIMSHLDLTVSYFMDKKLVRHFDSDR